MGPAPLSTATLATNEPAPSKKKRIFTCGPEIFKVVTSPSDLLPRTTIDITFTCGSAIPLSFCC